METPFSSQTLAEVFRDLYHSERSGVLHLRRSDQEKRIYIDRGMILFAESSDQDEDLGPRLVREGKISSGALAEARKNISESKDLPQALINRGLIGKETLAHTVRYIVDRIMRSVFQWEGGTSRFSEGWLLQEIFEADVVTTFELLLRAISTMSGFEPIRDALKVQEHALVLRASSPVPLERLTLSPAHGFVLSRIDGCTTLEAVLSILPEEEEEDQACRFLYGLLVMGVLEFDPPIGEGPFSVAAILREHADLQALEAMQDKAITEVYEALRDKNPFEILGIGSEADIEMIERAYEELKTKFGRDRFLEKVRERRRSQLSYIESRLVEAYLSVVQSQQRDRKLHRRQGPPGPGGNGQDPDQDGARGEHEDGGPVLPQGAQGDVRGRLSRRHPVRQARHLVQPAGRPVFLPARRLPGPESGGALAAQRRGQSPEGDRPGPLEPDVLDQSRQVLQASRPQASGQEAVREGAGDRSEPRGSHEGVERARLNPPGPPPYRQLDTPSAAAIIPVLSVLRCSLI